MTALPPHAPSSFRSYEQRVRDVKEYERRLAEAGVCGCGHPVEKCRPEVCSHKFARAAIWGDDR
jgi:hypothetical protein